MSTASNSLKTPLFIGLNRFASKKIADALQLTGRSLPCSVVSRDGGLVLVNFEVETDLTLPQVTIPIQGAEYLRLPIRPGCKGVTVAIDARLANITGQGGNAPRLDQPGNLTALVFMPVGSKAWPAAGDDDEAVLYSTEDCLLRVGAGGVMISGSAGKLTTEQELEAGNGADGTFTSQDGKTITVVKGIITQIV